MTPLAQPPDGLILRGLDGSNPLAFLAALGTLRTLSLAWPERQVKMAWTQYAGAWRPVVQASRIFDENEVIALFADRLKMMQNHLALQLADDLSVSPDEFRRHAGKCVEAAHGAADRDARIAAEFAASFACDVLKNEQGKVQDTALRTMSGAGHQHFLKFMRQIVKQTTPDHLRKTLFAQWTYDDPVAGQTLRWDPADDSRYALQWRDPSGDSSRQQCGGMLGANRLAIEGLPLIVCAPAGNLLRTTGFVGTGSRDTFWTWPIWFCPVSLDVCRSLLAQAALVDDDLQRGARLKNRGIAAAFRCQRITVGKFRSFAPATAVF